MSLSISEKARASSVPSWGGQLLRRGKKITLCNTCPIDNLLVIFHNVLSVQEDIKSAFSRSKSLVSQTLISVHEHFLREEWAAGKYIWLSAICGYKDRDPIWDVYGSEFERFVKHLGAIQGSIDFSTCTSASCSEPYTERTSSEINLR